MFHALFIHSTFNIIVTRIIKTFSIKRNDNLGPKKYTNKIRMCNSRNKPLPYNVPYISIYTPIKQNTKSCTYVGLYGSGLFNFGYYVNLPTLFASFLGFYVPTSSFIFIENFLLFLFPLFFFLNGR